MLRTLVVLVAAALCVVGAANGGQAGRPKVKTVRIVLAYRTVTGQIPLAPFAKHPAQTVTAKLTIRNSTIGIRVVR